MWIAQSTPIIKLHGSGAWASEHSDVAHALSHAIRHKRLFDDGGQCRGGLRLAHGQRITAPSFSDELATTLSSGLSVGARCTLWSGATTCALAPTPCPNQA